MISGLRTGFAAACGAFAVLAILVLMVPAAAAEVQFPIGSRIGLVPPPGMVMSKGFSGFEDPDKHAAIIINTLPGVAYSEMEKTPLPDVLERQGLTDGKREPIQLGIGTGFLIIGNLVAYNTHYRKWLLVVPADNFTLVVNVMVPEADSTYSDDVVRAALTTLALRGSVPETEQLSLLPFKIGDLAGFHIGDIIPGRAVILIDAPPFPKLTATQGVPEFNLDVRLMIAAMPGGPIQDSDQAIFARDAFDSIAGIKNPQITMAEPIRINNQRGFETVAQAKDSRTEADIKVVQWLRFGSGGFLQMVGITLANLWDKELSRLRTVRDSIELNNKP